MTADGAREFSEAISALRSQYEAERLDGETAQQWLVRTGRDRGYFG